MGTFGKVLAVLNLLLALGFLSLLGADYAKRNAWGFLVLQDDFLLKGLPVDDAQRDADGRVVVDLVGKEMQKQMFNGIQAKTQTAEARQRHDSLVTDVTNAAAADKKKRLQEFLIPLARSAVERATLRERIRNAKEADLTAEGPLLGPESLYEAVFKETQAPNLAPEHRRGLIAHFLFCVSTSPADYQRTLAAVGLEAYVHEVEAQAASLQALVPEFESQMAGDRAAFVTAHRALVQEITTWTERVRRLQDDLGRQEAQRDQYKVLLAERERDKAALQKDIQAAEEVLGKHLQEQAHLEEQLVAALKTVAATSAANERLERQIRKLEQGQ